MPKVLKAPTKSYRCHRCNRLFARSEHLQRHERSHTKEKPFQCSQCPKAFTRKDLLSRHDRLSHVSGNASQSSPSITIPATQSPQQSLKSINILPDPTANHSSRHQGSILESAADILGAPLNDVEGHLTATGTSKSYEDHIIQTSSIGQPLDFAIGDNTVDYFTLGSIDDFTSFMDSVSVPTHPFSPTYQPVPFFFPATDPTSVNASNEDSTNNVTCQNEIPRHRIPRLATSLAPIAKDGNSSPSQTDIRLAPLQLEYELTNPNQQDRPGLLHMHISTEYFDLPSRHVLSRFFGGYFDTFHDHFPFLHIPTLRPENISVELFLAMAAIGARYTHELEMSSVLFQMAKVLVFQCIRRHRATHPIATHGLPLGKLAASSDQQSIIQTVQAMLLLVAITTWSEPGTASDALSMRSMLDCLIREEEALRIPQTRHFDDWKSWVYYENIKRVIYVAYCFINMHTIVFDIPPLMWAKDINFELPCREKEWRAKDEVEWKQTRDTGGQAPLNFQETFASLFANAGEMDEKSKTSQTSFSSFGGCVLMHTLIQQIWLTRNSGLPSQQLEHSLPTDQIGAFENALRTWAMYWEHNQESSMDPLSPHGPIAFTSTALMRLAYIRLNMNLGPIRCLSSWDPHLIAQSLHASPPVQRSERLTRAALHCAHALSIPVKLGINHIAETQVRFWSNQHALCSLECALLLAKWLESVTTKDPNPPLTQAEERLLDFVVHLVAEAAYKVRCEKIWERKKSLNVQTVRLWARLYQSKSVWEVVGLIGASLNIYADILEQKCPEEGIGA
ncbi:fungal specific transcription factor domain-containing protein [Trichoderma breve]|uniref:Fungal specific transcription factor domain-containing protein n=1 Tax=Trichoderma breve TaxID=2034170 RepID=A0A9W9BCP2_9HYPO|nr:fungal specific transcription factor domain-containing protein [Trichoderma breve]KAJ4857925.1 fungal specific transcription factor domain-containing protein [Trichoderma breve]